MNTIMSMSNFSKRLTDFQRFDSELESDSSVEFSQQPNYEPNFSIIENEKHRFPLFDRHNDLEIPRQLLQSIDS